MTMLRPASSRNHRSKGFKVRHALQICVMIAICIWLLYQFKHSHEKKRAFEERNSKNLNKVVENPEEFFKLGRKDLPHIDEIGSANQTRNKEDENEEVQEEEPATKQQEGIDDDDIDEQDQEKDEKGAENGEESTEEEDKDSNDEVDFFDNQEHEGGSHEAREENYKRDDASSAVAHGTLVTESENGNGDERSMEEQVVDRAGDESNDNGSNHEVDSSTDGSKSDHSTNTDSFEGEVRRENLEKKLLESTDNLSSIVVFSDNKNTEVDNKDLEIEFSKPDNGSVANSTIAGDINQVEQKDNSTMGNADDIALSNVTINFDIAQDQNFTGDSATLGEDKHTSQNVESEDAAHEESENLLNAVITEEEKIDRTDLSTLPDIQNELQSMDDEASA